MLRFCSYNVEHFNRLFIQPNLIQKIYQEK